MNGYTLPATSGFLLSFTLGWGDIAQAFMLGAIGAAGGMVLKMLFDWARNTYKNRKKKVTK